MQVGQEDRELLRRSVELGGVGWGDAGRRKVKRGDEELLGRPVELGGTS